MQIIIISFTDKIVVFPHIMEQISEELKCHKILNIRSAIPYIKLSLLRNLFLSLGPQHITFTRITKYYTSKVLGLEFWSEWQRRNLPVSTCHPLGTWIQDQCAELQISQISSARPTLTLKTILYTNELFLSKNIYIFWTSRL